ncbi:hypothetical protein RRSWK_03370 [Rhodopirellula sp. SWK7]|nr:hypothetical protein RRSWK_03370 [Rhodopirellula sp. SWK7]
MPLFGCMMIGGLIDCAATPGALMMDFPRTKYSTSCKLKMVTYG